MLRQKALRISQVGLRGVVGAGLTAPHVIDFASAFGTFVERGRPVLIGRDPRASGVMLREGVLAGLLACGHEVIDLGIVSSPVIQHAIRRFDAAGGISIGASHNTAEWNALKFFGARGNVSFDRGIGRAARHLPSAQVRVTSTGRGWAALRLASSTRSTATSTNWPRLRLRRAERAADRRRLLQRHVIADPAADERALRSRSHPDQRKPHGTHFAHDPRSQREIIGLQLAPLIKPLKADAGFHSMWIPIASASPPSDGTPFPKR